MQVFRDQSKVLKILNWTILNFECRDASETHSQGDSEKRREHVMPDVTQIQNSKFKIQNSLPSRFIAVFITLVLLTAGSCTERSATFELDPIEIGVGDDAKTRAKRERQFIQTLYNHIYQAPLPPSKAVALDELLRSIGDRQLAIEVVVAKMVDDPTADLPSLTDMRDDPETFTSNLYRRLYVRDATQAELSWWVNYLETHPDVDVAQVVFSFVTANEYRYY